VYKYAGVPGVLRYVGFAAASVRFITGRRMPRLQGLLSENRAVGVAPLLFVAIVVVTLELYPHVNTHIPGHGSDSDDALVVGVRLLLHGHYPYYGRTYLGNEISDFPGQLLMAVPFVLLGSVALQNVFWLGAFFVTVSYVAGRVR
jgi:hypothetical protein